MSVYVIYISRKYPFNVIYFTYVIKIYCRMYRIGNAVHTAKDSNAETHKRILIHDEQKAKNFHEH